MLGRRSLRVVRANRPRHFAELALPQYKTVQFKKEDMAAVMKEVPDFDFYHIGTDAEANKFKDVNMTQAVEYTPAPSGDGTYKFSKLENGLKVVTCDNGGDVAEVGLYVKAGSRWEKLSERGATHMLELCAFRSTAHLSHLRTVKTLEQLGVTASCTGGRESVSYKAAVLREYVPIVVPLLVGNVLFPRLLPWEVNAAHELIDLSKKKMGPDAIVTELLIQTAYHNNTVGVPLQAGPGATTKFAPETLRDYMLAHFAPERMVMVGVNCEHDTLATWAMRSFVDYNAIPFAKRDEPKAKYTGGCHAVSESTLPNIHFAMGFEHAGGYASKDLYAVAVLQALLGSWMGAPTPGAGLGTKLAALKDVESAASFYVPFSDTGIFGVYVSAPAASGTALPGAIKEILKSVKPSAEELARAKASATTMLLSAMEDSSTMADDIASQILMTEKVATAEEMTKAIAGVSEADVTKVASAIFATTPTIMSYGNISCAPLYAEVLAAYKK
jgi:processing peptidase subunit alpha